MPDTEEMRGDQVPQNFNYKSRKYKSTVPPGPLPFLFFSFLPFLSFPFFIFLSPSLSFLPFLFSFS
jgi:hypothetical protein